MPDTALRTAGWLAVGASLMLPSPSAAAQQPRTADVCYEIFVRSFFDSDGDGIGDLNGLTAKLDYINDGDPASRRDLGARCIWLMPVAESPSYHGYDVSNYYRIEPDYGTNADFLRLVEEAHRRGIRVLVDLVLNHASSEHPFFQDALRDPASPYRRWFRFAPQHPGVRNPWGGDNWHRSPARDEYYYGLFWGGMPDLNYEHPAVREEAKWVAQFWLREMGVDGFRLDAIPFLIEEGTRVQHAPGTHVVLREFAAHVRQVAPRAFTIGEVWDSTGAMLAYYPDQLDAHFAFEVSDAIVEAVRSGSAARLLPPVLRLQRQVPAERWAPFLRNHDQTRTLTALGGDVRRARLAAMLLFTMPGVPFVYYGEEIGMTGDKPDERLRTPMHWRRAPAAGFTTGAPWQPLHPDSFTANVEVQDGDRGSLLNLYRSLIHLRGEERALSEGALVPLASGHPAVAAYLRRASSGATRPVLVLMNLGTAPVSSFSLSSEPGALPAGRYEVTNLLDGTRTSTVLRIGDDGRVAGFPLRSLAPLEGQVFVLTRLGT